jgi:hypothetical protein
MSKSDSRRFLGTLILIVVFFLGDSLPASAAAYWQVDDSCGGTSDTYFYPSGPLQYWRTHSGGGFNGCHMWTYTVCGNSSCNVVNWANWYLPVNSAYNGYYGVWIWRACASSDSHWTNDAVRYQRWANGTGGGSTETYVVDQHATPCDQSIRVTASDYFQATAGGKMRMIDKSSDHPQPANADFLYWYPA